MAQECCREVLRMLSHAPGMMSTGGRGGRGLSSSGDAGSAGQGHTGIVSGRAGPQRSAHVGNRL